MVDFSTVGGIAGQLIGNYLSGGKPVDPQQIDHRQAVDHYQQLTEEADPQQLQSIHRDYYQQVPETERQQLFNQMAAALEQQGVSLNQLGVKPQDPSPQNLAYLQQQVAERPDLLQSIFGPGGKLSSPLAKMALGGVLAFAASRMMGPRR